MPTRLRQPPYRFKSGKFAGKTMEQVILRNAPRLYQIAAWAKTNVKEKPNLGALVREFNHLRKMLKNAPVVVHCRVSGCKRPPRRMTLPLGLDRYYWPAPYFWCKKHSPWEEDGISSKLPISFDTINSFEEKKNRSAVHESVLRAYGVKRKRSAITEAFATSFFANLH